jgi:ABC-type Mn2+/Zn2+ transport system ATPase subunit
MKQSLLLKVADLSLNLSGRPIFGEVNFELKKGDRLLLQGKNGAGKTSLLKCLAGTQVGYSGLIEVATGDINILNPMQRASLLAYVPQCLDFKFPITVARFLEISVAEASGAKSTDWYSKLISLCPITHLLQKLLPDLSLGEKRKVAFISALAANPKIILLDETSSALDSQSLQSLQQALAAYTDANSCAVIEVSHESRTICKEFNKTIELSGHQVFESINRQHAL